MSGSLECHACVLVGQDASFYRRAIRSCLSFNRRSTLEIDGPFNASARFALCASKVAEKLRARALEQSYPPLFGTHSLGRTIGLGSAEIVCGDIFLSDDLPEDPRLALRIHETIAQNLGRAILLGKFQPGEVFGGEVEQSEALGVSRTAYREAIRTLVAKGFLQSKPKSGTRVTPKSQWSLLDPDVLAWMFQAAEPDQLFVKDLFELRGVIEPAAASFAAARRSAHHVEEMRACLAIMRSKGLTTEVGRDADRKFHSLILEASGNAALASLSSSVGAAVAWTTKFKHQQVKRPRDPIIEHLSVFEAIEASHPQEARAAMEKLLESALEDMR